VVTKERHRKSTIVVPVENADDMTADQFTKVLMNIHNREGRLKLYLPLLKVL
jgi:hypothetical protein